MYLSTRWYEKVSNTQELARHVREDFVPLISAVPGFIGYYFTNAGDGTVLTTSIFETKANAEESNRVAAEWVKKNPKVLPTAARVTTGEVIGHKVKETTGVR
ncbi:MAG TPA: hypothetical protein VKZ50_05215 [bacterium]|nr:hypothetical protein [bacterium]